MEWDLDLGGQSDAIKFYISSYLCMYEHSCSHMVKHNDLRPQTTTILSEWAWQKRKHLTHSWQLVNYDSSFYDRVKSDYRLTHQHTHNTYITVIIWKCIKNRVGKFQSWVVIKGTLSPSMEYVSSNDRFHNVLDRFDIFIRW